MLEIVAKRKPTESENMSEKVANREPVAEAKNEANVEPNVEADNCSKTFFKWICCKSQEGAEVAELPPKAIGSIFIHVSVKVSIFTIT